MKETYLHIKLVRPFVGYLTLRLAWPESFAPDALMVSSQGDVVFDLARREGNIIYYEPRQQEPLLLEPGVHAVRATSENAGHVYYIVHTG